MKHFDPGQEIAGVRIERELGAGTYGRVYLAVDQTLQRKVALKLVPAPANEKRRKAALREARMVGSIKSAHVVTLHRAVELEEGGAWLLEMEYVAGGTLTDLLAKQETIPVARAIEIAAELASALGAAHDVGVVHADVKPGNVLLETDGTVKLADFGLSWSADDQRFVSQSAAMGFGGTPAYMAPEVVMGEPLRAASDMWSLGVVLFRMLTGRLPFPSSSLPELFFSIQNDEPHPLPPRLPDNVVAVVAELLEKDPTRRLQYAENIVARLRGAGSIGVAAHVSEAAPRASAELRTKPLGRDEEIRSLLDRFRGVATGGGATVHLVGDAGIGKTAVVNHIVERLRADGAQVIETAIDSGGLAIGSVLHSVRDAIGYAQEERLDPHAREIIFGARESVQRGEAGWAIGCALETISDRGPVLVVVENVHVCDDSDVALLRELALNIRNLPVLLVLTSRTKATDVSASASSAKSPLLQLSTMEDLHQTELGPLSAEHTMQLLRRNMEGANLEPTVARRIVATAEGNPLFAEQLLQHLLETGAVHRGTDLIEASATWDASSMPNQFQDVVEQRLMGLDDADRALLDAASVDGREFDGTALAAATERPVLGVLRDLQRLYRQRKLIGPAGAAFRFTSQVVHQVVYEAISPALRQALHELLARHYEGREDAATPERLGTHWELAGDSQRARPYLLQAALTANAAEDSSRMIEFCHRAGILEDQVDAAFLPEDSEVWLALARGLRLVDKIKQASRVIERLLVDGQEQSLRDRAMIQQQWILARTEGPTNMDPSVLTAVQARNAGTIAATDADGLLAAYWKFCTKFDQALVHAERCERDAHAIGHRRGVAFATMERGSIALRQGQFETAESIFANARELYNALGYPSSGLAAEVNGILARVEIGAMEGVPARLRTVADSMRIAGNFEHAAKCCLMLASIHYDMGNISLAVKTLAEAQAYVADCGESLDYLLSLLDKQSMYALANGAVDDAIDALRLLESAVERAGTPAALSEYTATAAAQFGALGDLDTASRFASKVPELLEEDVGGRTSNQVWPALGEAIAFGVSGAVFADVTVAKEFAPCRDAFVAWSDADADPAPLVALAGWIESRPGIAFQASVDMWRRAILVEAASRSGEAVEEMVKDARAAADRFGHAVWRMFWLRESVERCGNDLDAERLDECLVEFANSTTDPTRQRQIFLHWAARP